MCKFLSILIEVWNKIELKKHSFNGVIDLKCYNWQIW